MIPEDQLAVRIQKARDIAVYRPQLEDAEKRVMSSLRSLMDALRDIQKKELWRYSEEKYESLDDYCKKRWGFGERRRQQLTHADDIRLALADVVTTPEAKEFLNNANEGQIRAVEAVAVYERPRFVEKLTKENPHPTGVQIIEKGISEGLVAPSKRKPRTEAPRAKEYVVCPKCGESF